MRQRNKAFTLIELLVVVLIIGILAAVALPQYQKVVLKSQLVQMQIYLDSLRKGAELYYLANGTYPVSVQNLEIDITNMAKEIKQSEIASHTQGVFFANGVECMSNSYAVACMSSDFYLVRKHDHAPEVDWPDGIACVGNNEQADQICQSMNIGGTAEVYANDTFNGYIIGN